jgi:DNA-directed RNA polymerase beta subunit
MVANYLDYIAGFRELDDRDHWANKRVEGPGRKKAQLLRNSWNKVISDMIKILDKTSSNEKIYKFLSNGVICKTISKYFNDSIKNSKWGVQGGKLQNNATQILNRDNMFATWSHINTINVTIQRTDKNKKIRQIPPNQLRKVGYIKSPEGSNCIFIGTPVKLGNGQEIAIGDLKDGDEVLTIDPITLEQSPSIIKNHFIKSTEEYGKPVVKITTNGKEVICTDDHPFLTQSGWVLAKDLDIGVHKMVMYQNNKCLLMSIEKIEPHPHCMVADFTTESENHSFIANGYCVHNCGLVKPLAITTRISLDRGIEGDRIVLKYITYTEEKTIQNQHIFILNGKYIGWVDGPLMHKTLISARRNGNIYYDTSFFMDNKSLYADSSPSRLISPVLIVDPITQRLVMDMKNITNISPLNLIQEGAMEYISAWEEINCKVATDFKTLHEKTVTLKRSKVNYEKAKRIYKDNKGHKREKEYKEEYLTKRANYRSLLKTKLYTHCDMSGRTGFGVAADTIPFIHHNEGPRNVYQSGMITQAISVPHLNHRYRFDNMMKVLESPVSPIVKTDMYDILGLTDRGIGQNVIIGVASADDTEEDAIIFNQGAIDRGLFRIVKYFTIQGQIKISDPVIKSYYGNPSQHGLPYDKKYKNLNEHGLPVIGSYLDEQDCVIGIIKEKSGVPHDDSIYLNYGEKGIVDDIIFHETDTHEIITVKIRHTRIPSNGDKYAARYSQKGTIKIIPELEMPFSERSGMIPDVLINVTVFPSRKTVSYFYEILTGKAAALSGETVDATAFEDIDMDKWNAILVNHGYNNEGTERLRDGIT